MTQRETTQIATSSGGDLLDLLDQLASDLGVVTRLCEERSRGSWEAQGEHSESLDREVAIGEETSPQDFRAYTDEMRSRLGEELVNRFRINAVERMVVTADEILQLKPSSWEMRKLIDVLPKIERMMELEWHEQFADSAVEKIVEVHARVLSFLTFWMCKEDIKRSWPRNTRLSHKQAKVVVNDCLVQWAEAFQGVGNGFAWQLQGCLGVCRPLGKSFVEILYEFAGDFRLVDQFLDCIDQHLHELAQGEVTEETYDFVHSRAFIFWQIAFDYYSKSSDHKERATDLRHRVLQWMAEFLSPDLPEMLVVAAESLKLFEVRDPEIRQQLEAVLQRLMETYERELKPAALADAVFRQKLREVNESACHFRASIFGTFRDPEYRWPVEVSGKQIHGQLAKLCRKSDIATSFDALSSISPGSRAADDFQPMGTVLDIDASDLMRFEVNDSDGPNLAPTVDALMADGFDTSHISEMNGARCSIRDKSADCSGFCLAVGLAQGKSGDSVSHARVLIAGDEVALADCHLCLPFEKNRELHWLVVDFTGCGDIRPSLDGDDRVTPVMSPEDLTVAHIGVSVNGYPSKNRDDFLTYFATVFPKHIIVPRIA